MMNDKEMADFLLELRGRHEMPINEDEYYLLGDIAERLIELSEQIVEGKTVPDITYLINKVILD